MILKKSAKTYMNRQKELDAIKWNDSMMEGEDTCGAYMYCGRCRKIERHPCAHAEERYQRGFVRIAIIYRHAQSIE